MERNRARHARRAQPSEALRLFRGRQKQEDFAAASRDGFTAAHETNDASPSAPLSLTRKAWDSPSSSKRFRSTDVSWSFPRSVRTIVSRHHRLTGPFGALFLCLRPTAVKSSAIVDEMRKRAGKAPSSEPVVMT